MQAGRALRRVFLSHASEDAIFAERLANDLRQSGADVWLDTADLRHGNFLQRINEALASCDWMVLVLTPAAIRSQYVQMEVYAALGLVAQRRMQGVIPVVS